MTEGRQNGKRLLGRVAGAVTERVVVTVDPDIVLEHVDLNALLSRVDVDAVLARVDMDALLARVDLNTPLADVDLDALLRNVDLEALVRRSGIPDIVAESTYSMAGSALDVARRQLVGLDVVVDRIVDRLMRRSEDERREGPPNLVAARRGTPDPGTVRRSVSGHYAGAISRAAAAAIDGLLIAGLYTLGVAGFGYLLEMFTSTSLTGDLSTLLGIAAFAIWAFSYVFISLAITGRTIGKGLAGLRVVRADGTAPGVRTMFVRTLVFPLSVIFFGIGLLLIVVQREHRAVHDLIAKTCVVYDWGDRSAEMPGPLSDFLNRAQSDSPQR
jgi:uncharacterized RDD family membrane protein YckC